MVPPEQLVSRPHGDNDLRVSKLGLQHQAKMRELLEFRSKIGKQQLTHEEVEEAVTAISFSMRNMPHNVFHWGLWHGGTLNGFMSQSFWKQRPNDWVMTFVTLRPGATYADYATNGMDLLWRKCFDTAQGKGRRIGRWSMPLAWSRTQFKTQKASPTLANCHIEQYLTVPAGELPTASLDRWVFGERPKPYDVVLKKGYERNFPAPTFDLKSEDVPCSP